MTEAQWVVCEDWRPMMAFLSGRLGQRKAMFYVFAASVLFGISSMMMGRGMQLKWRS